MITVCCFQIFFVSKNITQNFLYHPPPLSQTPHEIYGRLRLLSGVQVQSEARDHSGSDSCTFTDGDKLNSSVNESANPSLPPPTYNPSVINMHRALHAVAVNTQLSSIPTLQDLTVYVYVLTCYITDPFSLHLANSRLLYVFVSKFKF